jgi:hypothetical protein
MTTLEKTTVCDEHSPNAAISTYNDEQFTFCEVCEKNIERFYIEYDNDRLGRWSYWELSV